MRDKQSSKSPVFVDKVLLSSLMQSKDTKFPRRKRKHSPADAEYSPLKAPVLTDLSAFKFRVLNYFFSKEDVTWRDLGSALCPNIT
jgi:hypothetical protein